MFLKLGLYRQIPDTFILIVCSSFKRSLPTLLAPGNRVRSVSLGALKLETYLMMKMHLICRWLCHPELESPRICRPRSNRFRGEHTHGDTHDYRPFVLPRHLLSFLDSDEQASIWRKHAVLSGLQNSLACYFQVLHTAFCPDLSPRTVYMSPSFGSSTIC